MKINARFLLISINSGAPCHHSQNVAFAMINTSCATAFMWACGAYSYLNMSVLPPFINFVIANISARVQCSLQSLNVYEWIM